MLTEDFVNKFLDVRSRIGDEWTCLCPYHDDTSPSFSVNVKRDLFICFACGAKGTVKELAEYLKAGVTGFSKPEINEEDYISDLIGTASELKNEDDGEAILPAGSLARFRNHTDYWKERGFSQQTQADFELGYDPLNNHAIIPLKDINFNLVGVIRRQLDADAVPRYRYPKGFRISNFVFNSGYVRDSERIAIVEGSLDAIACYEAGIPAVALLGSRVSKVQEEILRKLGPDYFVVMTDRDDAGRAVASTLKTMFKSRVTVPDYQKEWLGKDPADLTSTQRRHMFNDSTSSWWF